MLSGVLDLDLPIHLFHERDFDILDPCAVVGGDEFVHRCRGCDNAVVLGKGIVVIAVIDSFITAFHVHLVLMIPWQHGGVPDAVCSLAGIKRIGKTSLITDGGILVSVQRIGYLKIERNLSGILDPDLPVEIALDRPRDALYPVLPIGGDILLHIDPCIDGP